MNQAVYRPGGRPDLEPLLRNGRSPLAIVTTVLLGLGALVVAVILFLVGGPTGFVISTLLAAVSFPLLVLLCFWLDRYEPEPGRYRLAALGWGAVVAVILSLVTEQIALTVGGAGDFVNTAIEAPLIEETSKGLFLVAIVVLRRWQVHGVLDGLVYAGLVGIGFAFVEDILYYSGSLAEGGPSELGILFLLRGVMSPFAHPLFTSATGIGIGLAVTARRPGVRVLAPILGFLIAVTLHGLWNGSTFWGARGYLTTYAAVMLPLVIVVLAFAIWARSREGRMLGTALHQVASYGWMPPEAIPWVARVSDRVSARKYAKAHGGSLAARVLRAYQQTMIEVAFLHARALQGTAPRDLHARLGILLYRAAALQPYLLLPPPIRPPALTPPPPR